MVCTLVAMWPIIIIMLLIIGKNYDVENITFIFDPLESFSQYCIQPVLSRKQDSFNGQENFSVFWTVALFDSRLETNQEAIIETINIIDTNST